jgi:hypothetical protein
MPNTVHFGPGDGFSGLGQNARTTGGAGILPAAILRAMPGCKMAVAEGVGKIQRILFLPEP